MKRVSLRVSRLVLVVALLASGCAKKRDAALVKEPPVQAPPHGRWERLPPEDEPRTWALAGGRLIGLRKRATWELSWTPLGVTPSFSPVPSLTGDTAAVLDGGEYVVGVATSTSGEADGHFVRSDDGGASFRDDPFDAYAKVPAALGPRGFLLTNDGCDTCSPRVRRAGATTTEDLQTTHGVRTNWEIYRARGDEIHLGGDSNFGETVYGRILVQSATVKVVVLGGPEANDAGRITTIAFDGDDVLLLTLDEGRPQGFRVRGTSIVERWPIPLSAPVRAIVLADTRGLAVNAAGAWETRDGGRHWSAISSPAGVDENASLQCAPEGCLYGDRIRAGWAQ